jgi:hypothetical protein
MHTIYFSYKKLKYYIFRNTRLMVEFEGLENFKCAECIGAVGHWKEHFIISKLSIK